MQAAAVALSRSIGILHYEVDMVARMSRNNAPSIVSEFSRTNLTAHVKYLRTLKQKRNTVGPSIRELRMRKGCSQASLSTRLKMGGLELFSKRLAKVECGLIAVRNHDPSVF